MPQKSILPFVILFAGFGWYALLAWQQRRANAQKPEVERNTAVPILSLIGALGLLAAVTVAGIMAYRMW